MNYFSASLNQTVILFLFIIVGYILKKTGIMSKEASGILSKLETHIFLPAMVIKTFMEKFTVQNLSSKYSIIIYSAILLTLSVIIGFLLSRIFSKDGYERKIYMYSLSIANFSYVGTAVVAGAFGQDMLFNYMLFCIPIYLYIYSYGVAALKPDSKVTVKSFLNPVFFSMIAGALLGITGIGTKMPSFLTTAIAQASGCMSPIAMLLTGIVIGGYKIPKLLSNKKVYICSVIRLIAIPSLFVGILMLLKLFNLPELDTMIILTISGYAMPLGLNTVVYPASYEKDTSIGASMALISQTLSVITIPLMFLIFV